MYNKLAYFRKWNKCKLFIFILNDSRNRLHWFDLILLLSSSIWNDSRNRLHWSDLILVLSSM